MPGVRVDCRWSRCLLMRRVWVFGRGRRDVVFRRRGCAVAVPASTTGRAQPALRIEQEHARGHDPLACLETASDFNPIRQLQAECHDSRLETITGRDEHVLLESGVDDRVSRNGDHWRSCRCKGCCPIKAWPETPAPIGRREAHT